MSKRHNDALAIQCGACNPSGIVHSLLCALDEIRSSPDFTGTRSLTHDPAVRLMIAQLAYICGISTDGHYEGYIQDHDACVKTERE